MSWVDIFSVLLVCHLVGDFLLQTEWQALHKFGGLGGDPVRRRALLQHVVSYSVPFVPALVWVGHDHGGAGVIAIIGVALITHVIQDDGRLLRAYMRNVKHTQAEAGSQLWMAIDQSFHVGFLFAAALLAATG
jgi:hypothetical protein